MACFCSIIHCINKKQNMDTTIYSDGKGTKVTSQEFITRDAVYLVQGIIDARMNQIKMSAVPAVFCIVAGLFAVILGAFHLLNGQPDDNFHIGSDRKSTRLNSSHSQI